MLFGAQKMQFCNFRGPISANFGAAINFLFQSLMTFLHYLDQMVNFWQQLKAIICYLLECQSMQDIIISLLRLNLFPVKRLNWILSLFFYSKQLPSWLILISLRSLGFGKVGGIFIHFKKRSTVECFVNNLMLGLMWNFKTCFDLIKGAWNY